MSGNDVIIGKLLPEGYLQTETGAVLLSTVPPRASRAPGSAPVTVDSESLGKLALARGQLDSGVLYSAEVVEIWPRVAGDIIRGQMERGALSASDILNNLENEPPKLKRCALVIGHKKNSPGAVNTAFGITEFDFNEKLAQRIEGKVEAVQVQRVYRRTWETLPGDINALQPHFIVSLHCNAFDKTTSGTEVLYYHRSAAGRKIAGILQRRLVESLGLHDRGIKPKSAEDRGGLLLRATNAPCVIAEPFFIDNDQDLERAQARLESLSNAYAAAIHEMSGVV